MMSIFAYLKRADSRFLHILVIAIVGLILSLPLILYGFPPHSDDATAHSIYYTNFARQLWAGDLYPRWLMDMNGGLGGATFFYYPPASYYLTSILYPFVPNDPQAWRQLGISASVAMIASGLFAYLWIHKATDRKSALIAAILYMAMPYHLHDLYNRGSLAGTWSFVWMPLILYFIDRIIKGHRTGIVGLAASYPLLIMTHLPTTLLFSIFPLGYACFVSEAGRKLRVSAMTAGAMLLGIGLSSIYLLPAMTTQHFILMENMTKGHFYYGIWFLFSGFDWRTYLSDAFWAVFAIATLMGCAVYLNRSNPNSQLKKQTIFWAVAATTCIFMMTFLSKPIWWAVSILQMVQFPWRFNSVLVVAAAFLAAGAFSIKKNFPASMVLAAAIGALILINCNLMLKAWRAYLTPYTQEAVSFRQKWLDQQRDTDEFRPRWASSILPDKLDALLQRVGRSGDRIIKTKIVGGEGSVTVNSWKPREIILEVNSKEGMVVNVSQFYYPGWSAYIDGQANRVEVHPAPPDGLISVSAPPGTHRIELRLERLAPEYAGSWISAVSALTILSLWIYFWTTRRVSKSEV